MDNVSFDIANNTKNYLFKFTLNCFEAAYATIGLVNQDFTDDEFMIDLCDHANPNSTIAIFHDISNSKLLMSVDGSEFQEEICDDRLGTEKFQVQIQLYGDETDGFKIVNPSNNFKNDE